MKLTSHVAGVFPIAPTPFFEDGKIDYTSIDRLAAFYHACGCTGVTVLGQLGEASELAPDEALEVASRMIGRCAHIPVVVGVSAPGFAAMRSLAREVMDRGAAGVMIAPPNTLRTDDQIVTYFTQATEAIGTDIPFVLQDYPLTFSVQMSVGVIRRIVNDLPSCVMLKHEDWPGLEKISSIRKLEQAGDMRRISILCGNGGLFLDHELARGADGANTGYAFTDMLCDLVRQHRSGDHDAFHHLFDAHLPLLRYEQQPGVGLAVRKYVLEKRGLIDSRRLRRRGATMSDRTREEVDGMLGRLAKLDRRSLKVSV
jgi:4-hydroxy-tetrahydrodipicolinate synthase